VRYTLQIDEKHQQAQQGIKRNSGQHLNDFPPNMREISPSEFWHWFGLYTPAATEFRQPIMPGNEDNLYGEFWGDLTLLYSTHAMTEGYAFTTSWDYTQPHGGPNDFWPRFFKFGLCIHRYQGMVIGNCLTKYTCQKCGQTYTIDSSD